MPDEGVGHRIAMASERQIAANRKNARKSTGSEDTELQPGDAVEVTLRYQDGPDAPPRKLSSSTSHRRQAGLM
jgi:hypothetical protein